MTSVEWDEMVNWITYNLVKEGKLLADEENKVFSPNHFTWTKASEDTIQRIMQTTAFKTFLQTIAPKRKLSLIKSK